MSDLNEQTLREALQTVKYPGFSRDIVSFGLVKEITIQGGHVSVQMTITTSEPQVARQIKEEARTTLSALPGVTQADILIDIQAPAQAAGVPGPAKIDGVQHVIAVASGKGGVGKSTVASNLALALAANGAKVGLCDCDLYGPSIALMFGSNDRPNADAQDRIIPIVRDGIKLMSMGFLLDDGAPAVLRGPMVTRYTQQFLRQVAWEPLDFLVLDLPPGTGDIQLTIVQTIALSGAVIVTTPQEVALIDARKASSMFEKTNVPVLGLVENMSYFLCPGDGVRYDIFGSGGAEREAARLRVPLLGQIPLQPGIRESGDNGRPIVSSDLKSPVALEFLSIAKKIRETLNAG